MKALLMTVAFATLLTSAATAQFHAYIRLNLNDCINCLGSLNLLKEWDEQHLPLKFIVRSSLKDGAALLNEMAELNFKEANFVYSDSIYDKLSSKLGGTLHLMKGDSCILNSSLGEIPHYILMAPFLRQIKIKEKYSEFKIEGLISPQNEISACGTSILIEDVLFKKIHTLNIPEAKILTTNLKDLDRKVLSLAYFENENQYLQDSINQDKLKKINKYDCTIQSACLKKDTLYGLITMPYSKAKMHKGKRVMQVSSVDFLCSFQHGKLLKAIPITYKMGKNYGIDFNTFSLSDDGTLMLPVLYDDPKSEKQRIIAEFSIKKQRYEFSKFGNVEIPKSVKTDSLAFSMFWGLRFAHYPLISVDVSFYFNPITNKWMQIQIHNDAKALIEDISFDAYSIRFLLKSKDDYYLSVCTQSGKPLRTEKIPMPSGIKSRIIFTDKDSIAYIDENNAIRVFSLF